jgi:acyl carrier protein
MIDKLISYLSHKLDVDEALIKPESHLIDDLGSDDFTIIELIIEVEDKWDCTISDTEARAINTVQDIFDTIERNRNSYGS